MNRRPHEPRKPDDASIPEDLRAVDSLLSEALAEWSRSDAARADRIHRATVGGIRRIPYTGNAGGWRWALYVGGGLAAAAMLTLVLRSGGDRVETSPAQAPIEVVEAAKPAAPVSETEVEVASDRSAAEPVLVALIERDASRWSEDWTADDSFGHSSAWAGVVPLLETRDTGFDTVAGEIGAILGGGSEASIR